MSILLKVNGTVYTNFISATVQIRLDTLSNSFSFSLIAEDGNPLPFRLGDSCEVLIDDDTVVTGNIEILTVDYSANSHTIGITGRDKTGDLLDSTLQKLPAVTAQAITLKQVIELVIDSLGADVQVVDNVNPEPFENTVNLLNVESGDGAWDFIQEKARQRQVLLTSNADGNIVITRSEPTVLTNGVLQNTLNATDNNVLRSNVVYDDTGRYNFYVLTSQLGLIPVSRSGAADNGLIVDQVGSTRDDNIRRGRQLVLIAEGPFPIITNNERALWEANIRKARGTVYSATVQGHRIGGTLWAVNNLVSVTDVFAGVSGEMLINSITFNESVNEGTTTDLSLVEKNSYQLTLAEPKAQTFGSGFL